jgi:putative CocE/NonD family hydrolase
MSDGVKLATDVYLPAKGKPPHPRVLIRTPYGKDVGKKIAYMLGPQGYAVVAQDMRGRFGSQGHHAIIFGNDGLAQRRGAAYVQV